MSSPIHVGIDLGTTNSAAAVFEGGTVSLVRNAQGATLTPSVVRIDARGNVVVGAKARRLLESDPANTRGEFKRLMGTNEVLAFAAAKVARKPEELSAEILRALRQDVQDQIGVAPERAVISVPALFELPQSAATSRAAELAGFERVELIQEPVASAIAAGWSQESSEGRWLVYDLGGGTFDVSLLEGEEGMLRVVGHDGDNFLGGRDFDWVLVDHALAELSRAAGVTVTRASPEHAAAVRRLKIAAEEAKIELARAAQAEIVVPNFAEGIDLECVIDRATFEALARPLIDRSIAVCRRLLRAHAAGAGSAFGLSRIVLVGGPTVIPLLRSRVSEELEAPYATGLDPMTLVAQGAALYAATTGLDARPRVPVAVPIKARHLLLQYPPMSSDLTPHIIGRVTPGDGGAPKRIRFVRSDGWTSEDAVVDDQGAFVAQVQLAPRRANELRIEARDAQGDAVAVHPASITLVQGVTINDPPLSRSIGVARADDTVRVYLERGAPLPARRTFTLHTVETVAAGEGDFALKIPIVQGELSAAHLCRLVGELRISGREVKATLPMGSAVEVTLDLDRGGRLSARAHVPSLDQIFEDVAHLVVPEVSAEGLEAIVQTLQERIAKVRGDAFRRSDARVAAALNDVDAAVAEVVRDLDAARGGDADAAQRARRGALEIDALVAELEAKGAWPEIEQEMREKLAVASYWVSMLGTDHEKRMLAEASSAISRAAEARSFPEIQRHLRLVTTLTSGAYVRHPQAWEWEFEHCASHAHEASDLLRAQAIVDRGRAARARGDSQALRQCVHELRPLLPADAQERRLGYGSGVR